MATKFSRDMLKGSTKTEGDFHQAGRFHVEIENVTAGGIHTVEGLDQENETVEYQDSDDRFSRLRPGRKKFNKITLTRDWSSNPEFYDWFKTVIDGKTSRKSVSFSFLNDQGVEATRVNIYHAWPSKWKINGINARTSGHVTESIDLVFEHMELK